MNEIHLALCASPQWASYVETELLPWALDDRDLGDDVVEFGPGPGLTTDVLRRRVRGLTAVEIDDDLAGRLAQRLPGTNVRVVRADATRSGLPARTFSAVTCFTMLHHLPTPGDQDRLFAEASRILRPGGLVIGADGLDTPERRELHVGDTFTPVDPRTLAGRMTRAGLSGVRVDVAGDRVRFCAVTPA